MKWGIHRSAIATKLGTLPVCGSFITHQYDRYLRLKFRTNWRFFENPASRRAFARSTVSLSSKQQQIVAELNENGVSIHHIDELFQGSDLWPRLSEQIKMFTKSERTQRYLEEQQNKFSNTKDPNAVSHYIHTYYDQNEVPLIETMNPLLELAASNVVLDIVNSYLGLRSKLIYFDMWHTVPLMTNARILSQRWHRDPEDCKKVRIFLYYNDVDEDAGAMEYFAGSQMGGAYENVFPWSDPLTTPYPPDGSIDKTIPPSKHVILKGGPGTLVFCDTAGLHRGGVAKAKPRILATAAFVTPASLHRRRFEVTEQIRALQASPQATFAIS
jgi:hypothetical protein